MYQDLSTRHDWSVKKAIVDLPIRLKGNSKRISGNSLSPLGTQKKISALPTGVKLLLLSRLSAYELAKGLTVFIFPS